MLSGTLNPTLSIYQSIYPLIDMDNIAFVIRIFVVVNTL